VACQTFARHYGEQLWQEGLRDELLFHMFALWDFNLLDQSQVSCSSYFFSTPFHRLFAKMLLGGDRAWLSDRTLGVRVGGGEGGGERERGERRQSCWGDGGGEGGGLFYECVCATRWTYTRTHVTESCRTNAHTTY
jgi:hypothetical protein